jgi:hypothetical protein
MTMTVQQQRLVWGVLLAILLAWLCHSLAPILLPFITAWVMAYALGPWAKRLTLWGKGVIPHALSALLVELGFFFLVICLFALLTPIFSQEVPALKAQLPKLLENLQSVVAPLAQSLGVEVSVDAQGIKDMLLKSLDASWNEWFGQLMVSLKIGHLSWASAPTQPWNMPNAPLCCAPQNLRSLPCALPNLSNVCETSFADAAVGNVPKTASWKRFATVSPMCDQKSWASMLSFGSMLRRNLPSSAKVAAMAPSATAMAMGNALRTLGRAPKPEGASQTTPKLPSR